MLVYLCLVLSYIIIRTVGEEDHIKWQRRLDDYLEEMGPL